MNTYTRRHVGTLVVSSLMTVAVLGFGACDESSTPPSAQGGGGSPINNLAEQPQSHLGKSAGSARDVAGKIGAEQDAVSNTANDISGDPNAIVVGSLMFKPPTAWEKIAPANKMQAAAYRVAAGTDGGSETLCVFFANIGGSVESNVDRWKGQVKKADGSAADAVVNTSTVNGIEITTVSIDGEYVGMMGSAGIPNAGFRAAILDGPTGLVYARLVGPRTTVEEHVDEFFNMVRSFGK